MGGRSPKVVDDSETHDGADRNHQISIFSSTYVEHFWKIFWHILEEAYVGNVQWNRITKFSLKCISKAVAENDDLK